MVLRALFTIAVFYNLDIMLIDIKIGYLYNIID